MHTMSTFLYSRDLYRSLSQVWHSSPFTKGWPTVELGDFCISPRKGIFHSLAESFPQDGLSNDR
jgi:hypothetical protein